MEKNTEQGGWIIAKLASVWAMVGITSWADAASALAFFYTLCMLGKWWWDMIWRDIFISHGWIKPKQ